MSAIVIVFSTCSRLSNGAIFGSLFCILSTSWDSTITAAAVATVTTAVTAIFFVCIFESEHIGWHSSDTKHPRRRWTHARDPGRWKHPRWSHGWHQSWRGHHVWWEVWRWHHARLPSMLCMLCMQPADCSMRPSSLGHLPSHVLLPGKIFLHVL